jgi:predicted RNA-binding protein with PUA-like domain
MVNNYEYIKKLKNQTQKKKSITITIDEKVLDDLSEIADQLEISKNQIISDISSAFVQDFKNISQPEYYIINSNNFYMPEGHLHMLKGNRASAWGDTKSAIEALKPGDYVFIYMNEKGIVGAGTVKSNCMVNDYSLVKHYSDDRKDYSYDVWDEYFVNVEFDKKSLKLDEVGNYLIDEQTIIKASDYREKVSSKPLNRTKIHLTSEEGNKLKELYLRK